MRDIPVIILAGGKATRLGTPKTLFTHPRFGGYWVHTQLRSLTQIGLHRNVVVLGFHAAREIEKLSGVTHVINPRPEDGPFSSIQTGLSALPDGPVFILPIDVPVPSKEVWEKLGEVENAACVPEFQGRRGHPVFLDNNLAKKIRALPATSRLDHVLRDEAGVSIANILDPAILLNLNSQEDFLSFCKG